MNRREFLKACGLAAAAAAGNAEALRAAEEPRQPNIVFILADDLGWMDTTAYGSQYYETPNLDRLMARGVRFTDAYAANPLCSPTRASLMTGKYPARLKITTPAGHLPPQPDVPLMARRAAPHQKMICPRSRRFLPPEEHTLGEALKAAGYRTGFFGKWHLGVRPEHWPEMQGFDVVFHGAPDPGPPSYFSPYRFRAGTVTDGPAGEYITDRLADEAIRYVRANRDRPFFLCFWQWAVHAPFQGKEELVARYRARKDPRGKQDCPVMGAMVQSLDESVGRLLDALDELKLAGDTVILFLSDNGGNMYSTVEGTTPTNNAPLRSGKGSIYEGGHREPCAVVWPGVVKPGTTCSELVSSIDVYPTVLEMAGTAPKPGQTVDGLSLVPMLKGTGRLDREAIFCHFPHYVPATGNLPATSVRRGAWKLIRFYGEGPDRTNAFELYNLKDDVGETTNLAEQQPDRVRRLDALIDAFLEDTGALVPVPNPNYRPPVDGWLTSADCTAAVAGGALVIESTGGDPFVHTREVPAATGSLVLRFRMKSWSRGGGQVFWATDRAKAFHRSRRLDFTPVHDGAWHEYEVALRPEGTLKALRIDPSTAPGRIELDWVRLGREDGTSLREWTFDDPAPSR